MSLRDKWSPKFKPQTKYLERMERDGFVKVSVWVPVNNRDEICDIAAEMRHEFKEGQSSVSTGPI